MTWLITIHLDDKALATRTYEAVYRWSTTGRITTLGSLWDDLWNAHTSPEITLTRQPDQTDKDDDGWWRTIPTGRGPNLQAMADTVDRNAEYFRREDERWRLHCERLAHAKQAVDTHRARGGRIL